MSDYQTYLKQAVLERGFQDETHQEVFTLLVEEVGELAKAIRKLNGQKVDKNSKNHDVAEEAADVLFMLVDLCNRLGINLEQAFQEKEAKNNQRTWS